VIHPTATRFLPTYVGSKLHWLERLEPLRGRPIVELFAGSSVISANLASTSLLVDLDPVIARILVRFDEQIVPNVFTTEDYYRVRSSTDWWRYAYCLQSMSFSGVFRYSKNGFNAPAKGGREGALERSLRPQYEAALVRWQDLKPDVRCTSYLDITDADITAMGEDVVVVLDPPYASSKAAYNVKSFDYDRYWGRVEELAAKFSVVLFDREDNLKDAGYPAIGTRHMRVNGARAGSNEAMSLLLR
jgi:site-specific DNA-adenine methylase